MTPPFPVLTPDCVPMSNCYYEVGICKLWKRIDIETLCPFVFRVLDGKDLGFVEDRVVLLFGLFHGAQLGFWLVPQGGRIYWTVENQGFWKFITNIPAVVFQFFENQNIQPWFVIKSDTNALFGTLNFCWIWMVFVSSDFRPTSLLWNILQCTMCIL